MTDATDTYTWPVCSTAIKPINNRSVALGIVQAVMNVLRINGFKLKPILIFSFVISCVDAHFFFDNRFVI